MAKASKLSRPFLNHLFPTKDPVCVINLTQKNMHTSSRDGSLLLIRSRNSLYNIQCFIWLLEPCISLHHLKRTSERDLGCIICPFFHLSLYSISTGRKDDCVRLSSFCRVIKLVLLVSGVWPKQRDHSCRDQHRVSSRSTAYPPLQSTEEQIRSPDTVNVPFLLLHPHSKLCSPTAVHATHPHCEQT